jgi:hypothetical protein
LLPDHGGQAAPNESVDSDSGLRHGRPDDRPAASRWTIRIADDLPRQHVWALINAAQTTACGLVASLGIWRGCLVPGLRDADRDRGGDLGLATVVATVSWLKRAFLRASMFDDGAGKHALLARTHVPSRAPTLEPGLWITSARPRTKMSA